jgi:uncharacterized phage protein (TIGR01671 family)
MRRFRVYDKINNRYVDGSPDCYFIDQLGDLIKISEHDDHLDRVQDKDNFIVEQCTGLKDKNGKLIYEGDIVCYDDTLYSSYATKMTGVVVYRKASFCYKYSDCCGGLYQPLVPSDDFWQRKTEIVGNVHDMGVEDER